MKFFVRLVLLAAAALAIAFGALAFTNRDRLDTERAAIEREWAKVQPQFETRYSALLAANEVVRANGGAARAIVGELDRALADWENAVRTREVADGIRAVNALEGLERRLAASVEASPRLGSDALTMSLEAFAATQVDVSSLNQHIESYAHARSGPVRSIIADGLGHSALPRVAL